MSRVWYTSDLHFGHARVSHLRRFASTQEHDTHIVDVWNKMVSKKDTVYILGDIAVHDYKYALALLQTLPGKKHLISGNHDIVHPMHDRSTSRAEMDRWFEVFETIQPFGVRKLNKHKLLMSHFPYPEAGDGEHREGSRYNQFRLPDEGYPLMHGHTHGTETFHDSTYSKEFYPVKNQVHVGWDAWGRLVDQEEIIEWLNMTYLQLSAEDYAQIMEAIGDE